ncbi:MAG: AAA family ATPase [Proteobacteria bacterium]|nr:AAA family ATPase [Pseudomonadota bacterium]
MSNFIEYFKLRTDPFSLTPNFHFFYGSKKHIEVLKSLYGGIINNKGVFVLTGEVGTGKTITSRVLIEKLINYYNIAYIVNPFLSKEGIVKQIAEEFKIPSTNKRYDALITDIHMFLIEQLKKGRGALVFIDEAQHLSDDTLEMVRMLSNLETKQTKLLQFILIGQQELIKKLSKRNLRQIAQRVSIKCELTPLNHIETHNYILHRLKIAGGLGKVEFSKLAIYNIYKLTKGFPRTLNILMYHILSKAAEKEQHIIDVNLVKEAYKNTLPLPLRVLPFSLAKAIRGWL